jgi:hypothetical protein
MIHLPLILFILCYLIQPIKIQLRRLNLRNCITINFRPRFIILKGIMLRGRRTLTFNILCCLVLKAEHLRTSPQQYIYLCILVELVVVVEVVDVVVVVFPTVPALFLDVSPVVPDVFSSVLVLSDFAFR